MRSLACRLRRQEGFPRSARQRCLAHGMRNLAIKVSSDLWPDFKARVAACYQVPSRAIARELASGIRADYAVVAPSALACFDDESRRVSSSTFQLAPCFGSARPCYQNSWNWILRGMISRRSRCLSTAR
jgi:hypothetical protein